MRIALISFEYPPAVAVGGIGTYAWNAAHMLVDAGDEVEVFAAGNPNSEDLAHPRLRVHRIPAEARTEFAQKLVPALRAAQAANAFDVIEAPEIGPEGVPAFTALPKVARVVKLHTPSFLVNRVGWNSPTLAAKLRFWVGGLRRGRWRTLSPPTYDRAGDLEYQGAMMADEIAAPSRAIANVLRTEWELPPEKLHTFPLPFSPSEAFLRILPPTAIQVVGFLGRLEPRKGVVELIHALPKILNAAPHLRFQFIGPSWPYRGTDMQSWITRHHSHLSDRLDFVGGIDSAAIPAALARVDAVVLPSRWENFPFACWEALAAGRVVIGSRAGGMSEVIKDRVSGLLVNPRDPTDIARAVIEAAQNPALVKRLAVGGRDRVRSLLDPAVILPQQQASYARAIARATQRQNSVS